MKKINEFIENLATKTTVSKNKLKTIYKDYNKDIQSYINKLNRDNIVPKHILGRVWGDYIGFAYADLDSTIINKDLIKDVSIKTLKSYNVLPLYKFGNVITVATADPLNPFVQNKLEKELNTFISFVFCFPDDIKRNINILTNIKNGSLIQGSFEPENKMEPDIQPIAAAYIEPITEINKHTKTKLLENVKDLLNNILYDSIPDKNLVFKAANAIISDITMRFDIKNCISHLRITDDYLYSHCINVAIMSSLVAKVIGFEEERIRNITAAAIMHDIGFLKIPKVILYATNEYNKEEIKLIKSHTKIGYDMIKSLGLNNYVANIALNHHEYINGSGYPRALRANDIDIDTQIISIVSLYDTLITEKPNFKKFTSSEAINFLLMEGSFLFYKNVLFTFIQLIYNKKNKTIKDNVLL